MGRLNSEIFDFYNCEFSEKWILKQKNSCILNPGIGACNFENRFWRGFIPIGLNWCWWQMLETILLATNWDIGDNSHQHPQFSHEDVYSVTDIRKYFHKLIVNNIDVPVGIGELAISIFETLYVDNSEMLVTDLRCWWRILLIKKSPTPPLSHGVFPASRSLHLEVNSGYWP